MIHFIFRINRKSLKKTSFILNRLFFSQCFAVTFDQFNAFLLNNKKILTDLHIQTYMLITVDLSINLLQKNRDHTFKLRFTSSTSECHINIVQTFICIYMLTFQSKKKILLIRKPNTSLYQHLKMFANSFAKITVTM